MNTENAVEGAEPVTLKGRTGSAMKATLPGGWVEPEHTSSGEVQHVVTVRESPIGRSTREVDR